MMIKLSLIKGKEILASYNSYSYITKGKRVLILIRVRAYMEGECLVLNKGIHRWHVGIMIEMEPEGYIWISPKCILGFNKIIERKV